MRNWSAVHTASQGKPLPQTFGTFMFSDMDRGKEFYETANVESDLIYSYLPVPINGLFSSGQIGQPGRRGAASNGNGTAADSDSAAAAATAAAAEPDASAANGGKQLGQPPRKTLLSESSTVIGVLRSIHAQPQQLTAAKDDGAAEPSASQE